MKKSNRKLQFIFAFVALALITICANSASAHWLPDDGHKMHYPQLPDPSGWDICLRPIAIADDFECSADGAITEIHFWISFKDDLVDDVLDWYVAIYDDRDSQPGQELWRFKEGQITIREEEPSEQGWICPCNVDGDQQVIPDNHKWYALVNITEIEEPFVQERGKIYWLVIRANATIYEEPEPQPEVGWKTSLDHFGSPAMWIKWPLSTSDGWEPFAIPDVFPIDMAFVINGIIEPPLPRDFGDAPEECDSTVDCKCYPTTLLRNGARHIIIPGIFLGSPDGNTQIDAEPDGLPTIGADGDDINGIDDEEGVKLPESLVPGTTATVEVLASIDGYIDAWIDFNADSDWDDWQEKIFVSRPVAAGSNILEFEVPLTNSDHSERETYARFRFSTTGRLNYYGPALNGEVEDYKVLIESTSQPMLDFGDAPDEYPTLLANDGARHKINPLVRLGRYIDGEFDGQPTNAADGDDLANIDDEDGVYFSTPIIPGGVVELKVLASCDGFLNAWVDFNADGDWDDAFEQIFTSEPLTAGVNYLKFEVPPAQLVALETKTYCRFRFTSQDSSAEIGYAGPADDGEVEDYLIKIEGPQPIFDFGDVPELKCDEPDDVKCNKYPTTLARDGARHIVDSAIFLGDPYTDVVHIDAEPDGQPTLEADGDDINDFDDEDGVEFLTPLIPGFPAKVQVKASIDGYLDAWIDFNADGDWDDFAEHIFISRAIAFGTNYLELKVPPYPCAVPDTVTYARFRFSTYGSLPYHGPAKNGEVEDYLVKIESIVPKADLGDAPDSTNSFNVNMTAYTSYGTLPVIVKANYPTVYRKGSPPFGPIHWKPNAVAHLGVKATVETEADYGYDQDPTNNIIPLWDIPNLDGADDGVKFPINLPHCRPARIHYYVNVIRPIENLYVNVWLDWNRDGDWDDIMQCTWPEPISLMDRPRIAKEWAVKNQLLDNLAAGIYKFKTPLFLCWHPFFSADEAPPIWMRITLTARPVVNLTPSADAVGWGGSGPADGYWIGETEDYFFVPDTSCIRFADLDCDRAVNIEDLGILASQWLIEVTE